MTVKFRFYRTWKGISKERFCVGLFLKMWRKLVLVHVFVGWGRWGWVGRGWVQCGDLVISLILVISPNTATTAHSSRSKFQCAAWFLFQIKCSDIYLFVTKLQLNVRDWYSISLMWRLLYSLSENKFSDYSALSGIHNFIRISPVVYCFKYERFGV